MWPNGRSELERKCALGSFWPKGQRQQQALEDVKINQTTQRDLTGKHPLCNMNETVAVGSGKVKTGLSEQPRFELSFSSAA